MQNRQDAEDVVQTLFTDLLSKGQTNADLAYLYKAATNRCLNLIRDRKKRRNLHEQQRDCAPVARTTVDDIIIDRDMLARLVGRLDNISLEILVYRFFDDMSQEEISELTKKSRKTIGKRLTKICGEVRAIQGREGRS